MASFWHYLCLCSSGWATDTEASDIKTEASAPKAMESEQNEGDLYNRCFTESMSRAGRHSFWSTEDKFKVLEGAEPFPLLGY